VKSITLAEQATASKILLMINDLNISPLQDLLNLYNVTHPVDMHTERLHEHHRG